MVVVFTRNHEEVVVGSSDYLFDISLFQLRQLLDLNIFLVRVLRIVDNMPSDVVLVLVSQQNRVEIL